MVIKGDIFAAQLAVVGVQSDFVMRIGVRKDSQELSYNNVCIQLL
jgi:hypothetical protein